jgi:hypothetical protein
MQSLKTAYSPLKKKKKELKRFLEYTNAKNSNKFKIKRINVALFIELILKELIRYFLLVYSICY